MSSAASVAAYVPPQNRQSRFQRNLASAVRDGRLSCGVESHHQTRAWTDPATQRRFTDVERKPLRVLYDMMMPEQTAKCACLKAACEAQWNRNFHGAYTTTAIAPGSYTKGLDSRGSAPKKVYSVRYTLKPDELKFLASRFPEWFFVCISSSAHDHPIAHASTRIAAERLLDRMPRGTPEEPKVYVDLHGNPGANASYMLRHPGVRIITVVEAVTPKDYIRMAVKWGDELDAQGRVRWIRSSIRDIGLGNCPGLTGVKIDAFISIHTLYYYDQSEVVRLLALYRCPLHAVQHRFEKPAGTMNNGEQTYVKRMRSTQCIVYQSNVLTGGMYDHPDNNVWFDHDSLTWGEDGIGWDHNLLCDETYRTMIVYVPRVQCEMSVSCLSHSGVLTRTELPPNPNLTAQSQVEIAKTNTVTIRLLGASCTTPIESHHVSFFGDMRKAALGKARTAQQYKDHVSRCKIQLASREKTEKLCMDAQQLDEIARFSFFIDLPDQFTNDKILFDSNYATTIAAHALGRDGQVVTIAVRGMKILCNMLLAAADSTTVTKAAVRAGRSVLTDLNAR